MQDTQCNMFNFDAKQKVTSFEKLHKFDGLRNSTVHTLFRMLKAKIYLQFVSVTIIELSNFLILRQKLYLLFRVFFFSYSSFFHFLLIRHVLCIRAGLTSTREPV